MRRPWRSLRQLIDILLGQIAGVLVIPDAPVFHDESDRLFLPRFQQGRCAVSEILQLIGQRETARIRAQQHAVATCRIFTQPVQLILRALHQRHIAESVHPEIMLILRPVRKRFRPFDIQRHNRQRTEPAWSIQLHAGLLLVGSNQQQTDQIAVTLHLAMQTDQCAFTVAVRDMQPVHALDQIALVKITDGGVRITAPLQRSSAIQRADAGHLFQCGQNFQQPTLVMGAQRFQRGRGSGDTRGTNHKRRQIGVAQPAIRIDQRPHGHGLPLVAAVIIQSLKPATHLGGQYGIAGARDDPPRHRVGCQHLVDERGHRAFVDVRLQHVGQEILDELVGGRLVREHEMQIGEEFLTVMRIVANRVNDVIPTGGVHVKFGGRQAGRGTRLEHVGRGERQAAHVHHVEDAMRAVEIVGGHDDQRHLVDQILRELLAFGCRPIGDLVVRLADVGDDVALRSGRQIVVVHVEHGFEVVLLHVFAEERRVALAQREARLGDDAAQLVAGLHQQRIELAHEVRIALQIAQHGDDDRQGYQPLLPVDYVVTVIALAHQN